MEAGSTFTDALRKHPKLFDDLFVNMVAAGEVAGILDTILHRLAGYTEKAMKLKSKIKGAMIYPITIVTVAVGVTTILLVFVIPVFAELFSSFGQALPAPTQFTINLSNFTVAYFKYMLGVVDRCGRGLPPAVSDGRRPVELRSLVPAVAGVWRPDSQVGGGAIYADPEHAGVVRRSDPGRARHHGTHGR